MCIYSTFVCYTSLTVTTRDVVRGRSGDVVTYVTYTAGADADEELR